MARELDALLDLSRLQANEVLVLECGPTDLTALTRELVNEYQQTTQCHQIHHATVVPELVGAWDRARLERALGNLLANTIKDRARRAARSRSRSAGKAMKGENGPSSRWPIAGSESRQLTSRISSRGFIAGATRGTGVGLFDVRQILKQHGGTITVDNHEGRGATFTIRLPLPFQAS